MTHEDLDKQIEGTLKRNQAAIRRAKRPQRLIRIAERSDPALERALEKLRQNVR
jgi:hypothetical protein